MDYWNRLKQVRPDVAIAVALFVCFLIIYLSIGLHLLGPLRTHLLTVQGADSDEVIDLITSYDDYYFKTARHPLFLLTFNPFGWLLGKAIGRDLTALLFNTVCGAGLVALFQVVLRRLGASRIDAVLFSVFLGIAAGNLVIASIPETFIFTAFSILALLSIHVLVRDNRRFLRWFFPVALFAFGTAVTALAPISIILFFRYRSSSPVKRLGIVAVANVAIVAAAYGLALLQEAIYVKTNFFLSPDQVAQASSFWALGLFTRPIEHLQRWGPDLVINTVVASGGVRLAVVNFIGHVNGDHLGMYFDEVHESVWRTAAVVSYLSLVALALYHSIRRRLWANEFFLMTAAYWLFAAFFALVYDPEEILIFSPIVLIAWIPLIAFSCSGLGDRSRVVMRCALTAAVVLTAVNNARFIFTAITQLQAWVAARPTL